MEKKERTNKQLEWFWGDSMKKTIISFLIVMITVFAGCSGIDKQVNNAILNKSGILQDANYARYEDYAKNNELDADGYHMELPTDGRPTGSIRVAIANNNNLVIDYFSDEGLGNELANPCYVFPGDSIYARVSVSRDVKSSTYVFDGFRIYEYSDQDKRYLSDSITTSETEGIYRIDIPNDYSFQELSIVPLGVMEPMQITLSEACKDDDSVGTMGTWYLDNANYDSGVINISSVTPYIVSYQYDKDMYFCYKTEPECYYQNVTDGIVIFNQRKNEDETTEYSVVLSKYLSVCLVSDLDRSVTVNNGKRKSVKANEEIEIPHLKYGDVITLETDKEWPSLENCKELIYTKKVMLGSDYKYTMTVPEEEGGFLFNPADYYYENGTVQFKCLGEVVDVPISLAKGRKIYYEQIRAADGYWLAGSENSHCITVGSEEETIRALKNIHFTKKVDVTVMLPQPKKGGTIEYVLNGTKIKANSVSTKSGLDIMMTCTPWPGWYCDEKGTIRYIVGENNCVASVNGMDVDKLFYEDDWHKPELSVILEKSVGENMKVAISADGYMIEGEQYGGGWKVSDLWNKEAGTYKLIGDSQVLVNREKIGTGDKIDVKLTHAALPSKKAVKVQTVFKDKNDKNNERIEVQYLTDMSKDLMPIYIYTPGFNATSQVAYSSVEITIGIVDIVEYFPVSIDSHAVVLLKDEVCDKYLKKGDLLEDSTKVTFYIHPQAGYYIDGKNVVGDSYAETLKYSDYLNRVSDIVNSHPSKKYVAITLDKSDYYATYEYKLDGEIVSGRILAKEGQKLELTYKINDDRHSLTEKEGGFLGFGASDKEATKTIEITRKYDGNTITKSSFGLSVK